MMRVWMLMMMLPGLLLAAWSVRGMEAAEAVEQRVFDAAAFEADLKALTRHPHRLAGTPEGRAAGDHVAKRLEEIGVDKVFRLPFSMVQSKVKRCEIVIDGQAYPLLPIRHNVSVLPATGPDGLAGPMMYVGDGEPAAYGDRDPRGAIVVMDYNCGDRWSDAFRMGAKAVLFLGGDDDRESKPKHWPIPANVVRLYADPQTQQKVDLTKDRAEVTVHSHVTWEVTEGMNVIGFLRGVDPVVDQSRNLSEMLVLSASLDSFGQVPRLSPGARAAGNAAALLQATSHLKQHRPRRHVMVAFLDNHAQQRLGARHLYRALMMEDPPLESVYSQRQAELAYVEKSLRVLESGADWVKQIASEAPELRGELKHRADFVRADVNQMLALLRLRQASDEEIEALDQKLGRWDDIRRALSTSAIDELATALTEQDVSLVEALRASLAESLRMRRDELRRMIETLEVSRDMRRTVGKSNVSLHVTYNLAGGGPTWGIVAGDSTQYYHYQDTANADDYGHYNGVLAALRNQRDVVKTLPHLDTETLTLPIVGQRFVPGAYANDGIIAGAYGVYNVAAMTGADARERDGHSSDTVDRLQWRKLLTYAEETTGLLRAAADDAALSMARRFSQKAFNSPPRWSDAKKRVHGNFAQLMVTGGLREERPAAGGVITFWSKISGDWEIHQKPMPLNYYPAELMPIRSNGMFDMVSTPLHNGTQVEQFLLATVTDETGLVRAITTEDAFKKKNAGRHRVAVMPARGFSVVYPMLGRASKKHGPLKVIAPLSNVDFRIDRRFVVEASGLGAVYLSTQELRDPKTPSFKIFAERGPVLLGLDDDSSAAVKRRRGLGIAPTDLRTPPAIDLRSSEDMWWLNELRLQVMRPVGIAEASIERMHFKAKADLERADATEATFERKSHLASAVAREQRIYQPIRDAMNDLVTAAVILMLLCIPFAFAIERLVIGSTTIYGRLGGFVLVFIMTFAALYMLHPGFAVAGTPIIILLAFVIILLSSMVIYLLLRKFNSELRQLQGQSKAAHQVAVSQVGTFVAAANMGISTMRRRPLRTGLAALTVVLLSFTILCFASVGSELGVQTTDLGAARAGTDADVLVRNLDYKPIRQGILDVMEARGGEGAFFALHYWNSPVARDPSLSVVRDDDGRSASLNAAMGINPAELSRWDALAQSLRNHKGQSAKPDDMGTRGVFLPAFIAETLELKPGDDVLLQGVRARFAGTIDPTALQQLRSIDNESAMPVDFKDPAVLAIKKEQQELDEEDLADIQRSYTRLSPNQIAIASNDILRRIGGEPHIARLYLPADADTAEFGRDMAELLTSPVWVRGPEGLQRLVFGETVAVSAGQALAIPLLLGGLIVFGTMLGSITDREKEIYTFSALGLAPGHVGLLFFAEAAVYAIVGGMGGQILAQAVAVGAASLARAGYIAPPSLNFSSTNALFAIFVVMLTVMVSALYPARRASRSANPGLARSWKMPKPEGSNWSMVFPFTVSAYDITGVVSYLAEHFRAHDDAGLGGFAAENVRINRTSDDARNIELSADLALAPFDLGVTQSFTLTATPSEIPGVDEVTIAATRQSGSTGDWMRTNRQFVRDLRSQFLLWRTLSTDAVESYRMNTLRELGEASEEESNAADAAASEATGETSDSGESTRSEKPL